MVKPKLENIVGKEYVIDDPEILQDYTISRSLTPGKRPNFVVKPQNTEQVQKIVKLAAEMRIPITPLSSGVNCHGATIPDQGGIVLDLRRMNKILQIDERNRAVRIEPGVTWGNLQDELEKYGLRALNPLLPHSSKSVVTSHLELEPMLIPKFEYGEPIYTMEVVLPSGEIFRTGSAAGLGSTKNYQANLVGPYGPGIDFVRLFQGAQGTLGIVTWMNIKAEPLPQVQKLFFATFRTLDRLVEYIYRIQRRLLGYECFALNHFNLAGILAEKRPEDFHNLRKVLQPWYLIHCLGGTLRLPQEKVAYEEEDLKEVAQDLNVNLTPHIPDVISSRRIILKYLRRPWDSEPYWKDRYRGGCLDIFFYTTLDRVEDFSKILSDIIIKYGYNVEEIGVYIQPIEHGRACHLEFNLPYNPEKPDEVEKARVINSEACKEFVDKGAFFTRPYGSWADIVYNKNIGYNLVSRQIKGMFDPYNIMNPGKLCF
jgi:hypothetical protein